MGEPLPFHCPPAPFSSVHLHTAFLPLLPASQPPATWEESLSKRGAGPSSGSSVGGAPGSAAGLLSMPILLCRRETLQDVSFTVMPGQTLALVRGDPASWPRLLELPLF